MITISTTEYRGQRIEHSTGTNAWGEPVDSWKAPLLPLDTLSAATCEAEAHAAVDALLAERAERDAALSLEAPVTHVRTTFHGDDHYTYHYSDGSAFDTESGAW